MSKILIPKYYQLTELPEFKRFQSANPGKELDQLQTAIMFGRAIHWLSFFDILWPNFEKINYYSVEVAYIVANDPDNQYLPKEFYNQIAGMLSMFWKIQLEDLYPNGDWNVEIHNDPEITVDAHIRNR